MISIRRRALPLGDSVPATLGFNAVAPEWLCYGAAGAAPAIPAAESTLGSHPCVALSSAQVLPEWINRNLAANAFSANGDYSLNFVSHSRGSLQRNSVPPLPSQLLAVAPHAHLADDAVDGLGAEMPRSGSCEHQRDVRELNL
jgi:hypothetical protein